MRSSSVDQRLSLVRPTQTSEAKLPCSLTVQRLTARWKPLLPWLTSGCPASQPKRRRSLAAKLTMWRKVAVAQRPHQMATNVRPAATRGTRRQPEEPDAGWPFSALAICQPASPFGTTSTFYPHHVRSLTDALPSHVIAVLDKDHQAGPQASPVEPAGPSRSGSATAPFSFPEYNRRRRCSGVVWRCLSCLPIPTFCSAAPPMP